MEDIRTRPATNQYRRGWDEVFGASPSLATRAQAPLQAMRSGEVFPPRSLPVSVQPGPPTKGDGPALPLRQSPYDIQCPMCGAAPGRTCVRVLDRAPMFRSHAMRSER